MRLRGVLNTKDYYKYLILIDYYDILWNAQS